MPKSKYAILLILTLAFLVRLAIWLAYLHNSDNFISLDTLSYLEPGEQLLTTGVFPSFSRTPVYPIFLAFITRFISPRPEIIALIQIILSLITIIVTYHLANQLFGLQTARITALFIALDITSAISANLLLSETLFTFILIICLLGVYHLYKHPQPHPLTTALVGLAFSILALCRPIGFLLFVAIAAWLIITLRKQQKHIWRTVFIFSVLAAALPAAWMVRNQVQTGHYFLSTITAVNMYEYRAGWNIAYQRNRPIEEVRLELEQRSETARQENDFNPGELADWQMEQGIAVLAAEPHLTLLQGLNGLVKMYLGISGASIDKLATLDRDYETAISTSLIAQRLGRLINPNTPLWITAIKLWALLYLGLLYTGSLLTLLSLYLNNFTTTQKHLLWLLLLILGYFTFFSVGSEANSRFRIPVAPLLAILAAIGWTAAINWYQHRLNKKEAIS